jgi:hypothetical protein
VGCSSPLPADSTHVRDREEAQQAAVHDRLYTAEVDLAGLQGKMSLVVPPEMCTWISQYILANAC